MKGNPRVIAHLQRLLSMQLAAADQSEILRATEEEHAYWLEQQLGLMETIGIENYLAAQL